MTTGKQASLSVSLAVIISVLGTLVVHYVVWGRTSVSRADVESMISRETKVIMDTRQAALALISETSAQRDLMLGEWKAEQRDVLQGLRSDVQELQRTTIRMNVLLEAFLDERSTKRSNPQ